jgi:hypothetical protein
MRRESVRRRRSLIMERSSHGDSNFWRSVFMSRATRNHFPTSSEPAGRAEAPHIGLIAYTIPIIGIVYFLGEISTTRHHESRSSAAVDRVCCRDVSPLVAEDHLTSRPVRLR